MGIGSSRRNTCDVLGHDGVMPFCYLPPFDVTCIMKAIVGKEINT